MDRPSADWKKATRKSTTPQKGMETREPKLESKDVKTTYKNRLDVLTEALNCTSFMHKMRWPWFVYKWGGLDHPMDVDRFYQEKNIAIDVGLKNPDLIPVKEKLLKENGITYLQINNPRDVEALRRIL